MRVVLGCLVHDASEAYLSDIIRPVKKHLSNYMELEDRILLTVYQRFGIGDLTEEEYGKIRRIDNEILENEIPVLMSRPGNTQPAKLFSEPDFSQRDMKAVEEEYLRMVKELMESQEVI